MRGGKYIMKHGKYFMFYILVCSMLFCSCSKKGDNTMEEKHEIIKETKKEAIEEVAESREQEAVVDSELEKG